jgi:hypothetical protein
MLVTLGHCNTSAMNVSVLRLVFEPALLLAAGTVKELVVREELLVY